MIKVTIEYYKIDGERKVYKFHTSINFGTGHEMRDIQRAFKKHCEDNKIFPIVMEIYSEMNFNKN